MNQIDIFILAYLRSEYTKVTLQYLFERTNYPFRVFLLDNGGNEHIGVHFKSQYKNFEYIKFDRNLGVHFAWNFAMLRAESEYFITSDNDIYVPSLYNYPPNKLDPETNGDTLKCWLERLIEFMDDRPDYGAISLHPHVFIGASGIDPNDPENVKERNMCGAVMRIMRTKAVREVGGWDFTTNPSRNHEERTICSRLQEYGYKVGITTRIRAYHPFGGEKGNWGYPVEITPEQQGHNPDLKNYVTQFDKPENYDPLTWLPK